MKTYITLIVSIALMSSACKSKEEKKDAETTSQDKKNYLHVRDFLGSEIRYVDSLPLGISKYVTHPTRTDTTYIQAPEFDQFANLFLCPELDQQTFENEYDETSFIDQTTNAASFVYESKNPKLHLRRVDVIASSNGNSNNITSVYLEKEIKKNDTTIIQKLLWKTRKSLQVTTSKQYQKQPPIVEQTKIVWNPE
ncbi:MAG: hypothetical protein JST58_01225 [Bacteroidetes bacterium]|nr:hypothetical protein [Bacteroidota bacterium]